MDLGQNIKKARKNAGLTQQQLADKLGVRAKDVCRWETNVQTPNTITFAKICRELNASADEVLELRTER